MQEERRTGNGRRKTDVDILQHCMACDLRQEMKTKLSWKHFIYVFSGVLAILGVFLGIGVSLGTQGVNRMLNTSQKTLEKVQEIKVQLTTIKTNQSFLLRQMEKNDDEDREEGPHNRGTN